MNAAFLFFAIIKTTSYYGNAKCLTKYFGYDVGSIPLTLLPLCSP